MNRISFLTELTRGADISIFHKGQFFSLYKLLPEDVIGSISLEDCDAEDEKITIAWGIKFDVNKDGIYGFDIFIESISYEGTLSCYLNHEYGTDYILNHIQPQVMSKGGSLYSVGDEPYITMPISVSFDLEVYLLDTSDMEIENQQLLINDACIDLVSKRIDIQ